MSQAASGYDRIEGDRYYTPIWVTQALLSVEQYRGRVLDPAAGAGNIMDALLAAGLDADGSDIEPDAIHVRGPLDFLTATGDVENLITNPPYGKQGRLAVQFIVHALELTEARRGKVAMLLRVDFDSAHGRRRMFGEHPAFVAKYALTKRIRWANLPQSDSGPTDNHAWFCWNWEKPAGSGINYGYLP